MLVMSVGIAFEKDYGKSLGEPWPDRIGALSASGLYSYIVSTLREKTDTTIRRSCSG